MADSFFMQAVSHALDRYAQRQSEERRVSAQERMADSELREKYYYAGIIRDANRAQSENDRARLAIAERAQRMQEAQADVNNELVPLQKFRGVPGMIMQGFSADGKNVRRGDVPAMMQSYVGWLQATKVNQAENWRLGMYQKQMADEEKDRAMTWALLAASREGEAASVGPLEQQVRARNAALYAGVEASGRAMRRTLPGMASIPMANELVDAIAFATSPKSGGDVLPEEREGYRAAAAAFDRKLSSIGKTLDAFSDPGVNARVTPQMVGILSEAVSGYARARPTLSRFAERALMNSLDQKAKHISDVVTMEQYPEVFKTDLELARTRLQGEYGLQREEMKRR